MRSTYRNGSPIVLSSVGCDGCSPSFVQASGFRGIVHEQGCPEEWRDLARSCKECGTKFFPHSRGCPVCEDCERAAMLDPDPTCAGCGEVPPDCVCAERAERDDELDHFQAEE